MGIMIQPTKNRLGVYQLRKAVPKHLQGILNKREIKLTLDTKDVKEARERAPAKIIQIDMTLRLAEKQLEAEQSLTDADIEFIAGVWASRIMQQDELIRERYLIEEQYNGKTGLAHSPENELIHDWLEDRERKPRYKLETWQEERDVSICKMMAVELDEAIGYTPFVLTPLWRNRLAWRLAERRSDLTNAYLLNLRPRLYAKSKGLDILPVEKPKQFTFAGLFEHYKAHIIRTEPERAASRIRDYTPSANRFIKFIGDKSIREITKGDLSGFRTLLEQAPANRSKAVNSLSLENQAKAQGKKLSASTVRNIFMHLSAMFRVALEDDLLDEHPFDSFKMRKKVQAINEDIPFTDDEIRTIFRLPLFQGEPSLYGEMAYWIPIILYYTGARVEEIGQLRRADIVNAFGVPCFKIHMGEEQSVKTAGSVRYVPIHNHILELGFIDFVNTREGQLFAEKSDVNDKYAYNYGRWWGRLIRKHGVRKEVKPSHSFRHYFITQCRALDVREDTQNNVLGHVPGSVPQRYGSYLIETSRVLIERIPRLELKRLEN